MSDLRLSNPADSQPDDKQPEVRLELTRAGVQQVLSLYSQEQESNRSEHGFTVGFEDVQRAIRERRAMLVWGLGSGIAFALLVLWLSTPLYPVAAQVMLERQDVSSPMSGDGSGTASSAFIATQAEVMQSRSVLAGAVASIPRASYLDDDDDAVADAEEAFHATPVSGTQVVALGYLGPDATHGAQLLEAVVASYRKVLQRNETLRQEQRLRAKEAEIDALDAEAVEVENRLTALRVENGILGSAEETVAAQTIVLRAHSDRSIEVRNQLIQLENRLAAGGEQLAILDPAMRSLQEQLWQAEAELSRVKLTLMPKHPAVESAQQEVTVLRRQLAASSKSTPDALERDIKALRGLEEQLVLSYQRERDRMAEIEGHRRKEAQLLSEVERIREMSDARQSELLDQRLVNRLAESGELGVTARLIEAPVLPEEAAWPRPKFVLPAGALLGLCGGFIAAFVSLKRDPKVWVAQPPPRAGGAPSP